MLFFSPDRDVEPETLTDIHETFYIFFRYLYLPQATKPFNGAFVLVLKPPDGLVTIRDPL